MPTNRRQFLAGGLGSAALVTLGSAAPRFLLHAAESGRQSGGDRILVVVQLSGGNDGLNTVIPYRDDAYYAARPTLAVARDEAVRLNDEVGLHPSLRTFASLLEDGRLAIVQGVGYPRPNRSHFESMDIWHTCLRKDQTRSEGWIGRYLDETTPRGGGDFPGLHLGSEEQPFALAAERVRVPSVRSLDRFRLRTDGDERREAIRMATSAARPSSDRLLDFVQSSTTAALDASERVEAAAREYDPQVEYPESGLAGKLRTIAQLIDSGLDTRIYYVTLDGFDTHSRQAAAHAGLLREYGEAMAAFHRDLAEHGHGERVLGMTFSEFGRRVSENASEGTDHGAAAPMILTGDRVQAGVHGTHPSLADLVDGDITHHTDFRSVYATVLQEWLEIPGERVLPEAFPTLPLLG